MTPGNHPIKVKIKLIRNSVPKPCFRKTAKGGSRIHKITVSIDIIFDFFGSIRSYLELPPNLIANGFYINPINNLAKFYDCNRIDLFLSILKLLFISLIIGLNLPFVYNFKN